MKKMLRIVSVWILVAMLLSNAMWVAQAPAQASGRREAPNATGDLAAETAAFDFVPSSVRPQNENMSVRPDHAAQSGGGKECIPVVFVHGITGSAPIIGSTWGFGSPQYPLFQLLEANGYKEGETLFRFAYNWAQDNNSSAADLDDYIEGVKDRIERRIGVRPEHVSVVAHSMGGLVTRRYLAGHASGVDQTFTVGSPYAGSAKVMAEFPWAAGLVTAVGQLLPTWQAVFDENGNPLPNNGGFGYNTWMQSNVWPAPAPDIAFYGNQFQTAHTVTRTERVVYVYDPYAMYPITYTEPSYQVRSYIPGDQTVDWQSATTSVGSTRAVAGSHAGNISWWPGSSSRGAGGIIQAAAPQILSGLQSSSLGGPEYCYPYKVEVEIQPESMEVPACSTFSYEVKVLNRDTEQPVDELRANERIEIEVEGSALEDDDWFTTTEPTYNGTTPRVKGPGSVNVTARVKLVIATMHYAYEEVLGHGNDTAAVTLGRAPTRRDRCGRTITAEFDEDSCSWEWPNNNQPCMPDDNRSAAGLDLPLRSLAQATSAPDGSANLAVLGNGFDQTLLEMLADMDFVAERVPADFSPEMVSRYPVLLIPSGGLSGYAQSDLMRQRLAQYAANGGVILAFAQEYGDEFRLLPGGELDGYGYDEDINCQSNSSRVVTFAPMLLSQPRELLSLNVDGFFTRWPGDATLLLSRTANGMPLMIAHRYGAGWVLATTAYADMARYQGQGTGDETRLVRDLLTWALDPVLEIDRFGPDDVVTLPLTLTNQTLSPTLYADFSVVDQAGNWVLSSSPLTLTLLPGETQLLTTSLALDSLLSSSGDRYGQWRAGTQLYDESGEVVQHDAAAYRFASARFTAMESGHGYPGQPYALSVTSESEEYPYNAPALFTYNVFNHSDQEKTFRVTWYMIHHSWYKVPGYQGEATVTVPAHSSDTVTGLLERVVDLDRVRARLYVDGRQVVYAERGFWVVPARISQTATTSADEYNWGEAPVVTVTTRNSANVVSPVVANLIVRGPDGQTVMTDTQSFDVTPAAPHSYSLTLPPVTQPGNYSVSVQNTVYGRNSVKSSVRYYLAPFKASITPQLPAGLATGEAVTLSVTNLGTGIIPAPTLQARLATPDGTVVWSEERALAPLAPGQVNAQVLSVNVPGPALGDYTLSYDLFNAGDPIGGGRGQVTLPARLALSGTLDRTFYRVRDTGLVTVTLHNAGRFDLAPTLTVFAPDLGLDEVAPLSLAAGDRQALAYAFAVPADLPAGPHAIQVSYALVSDTLTRTLSLVVPPASVRVALEQSDYVAGDAISVALSNPGGVDAPLATTLRLIDSRGLVLADDLATPVVLAGGEGSVGLSIPVDAASGAYQLVLDGQNSATGEPVRLYRNLNVSGVAAGLSVWTGQPAYFDDEALQALASVAVTESTLDGGNLNLRICSPIPSEGEEPPPEMPSAVTALAADEGGTVVSPAEIVATLPPGGAFETPLEIAVGDRPVQRADVLFVFDVSGSMGGVLNTAKSNAINIMNSIRELVPDSAFGAASFVDYPHCYNYAGYSACYGSSGSGDYAWQMAHDITSDTATIAGAINSIQLHYGGDWPEDYARALYESQFVNWREGAKRIVIITGDAPTHDTTFYLPYGYNFGVDPGRDEIAGTGDDLVFSAVVEQLRQAGITVLPIYASYSHGAAINGFNYMADQTGGTAYNLGSTSNLPALIAAAVSGATEQVNVLTLRAAAPYDAWLAFSPSEFNDVLGGDTVVFDPVRLTVPPDTPADLYEFDIVVDGDGSDIATVPTSIRVTGASECGEVLWEIDLPVSTATTFDADEWVDPLNVTGRLLLDGRLYAATGQLLAHDGYPFYLFDRDTALTLETDKRVYRPDETIQASGWVTNTTPLTATMVLQVTANDALLLEQPLTLAPGAGYSYATSLTSETDVTLVATANGVETAASVIVTLPEIEARLEAPDVAGRAPFSATLVLTNTGLLPVSLLVDFDGQATRSAALEPGARTLLQASLAIAESGELVVTISGDVSLTLTHPIVQGEAVSLVLDAPTDPLWAGATPVPYTLSNGGLLPLEVPLTFTLDGEDVLVRQVATSPGQVLEEVLWLDLTPGVHELVATIPFQEESATLTAFAPQERQVVVEALDAPAQLIGQSPVVATLRNTGLGLAEGVLRTETDFDVIESDFSLNSGEAVPFTVTLDSQRAPAGGTFTLTLEAWINGVLSDQVAQALEVPPAAWLVEAPEFTLVPGSDVSLPFEVHNAGGVGAPFTLTLDLDGLYAADQVGWAGPTEGVTVTYAFTLPADLEARAGVGHYRINGRETAFAYTIAGYQLDMAGRLAPVMAEPDQAVNVTVYVTDTSGLGQPIPLSVRLAGVGEAQTQEIVLVDTAEVNFEVLAPEQDALLSFGLYHPEGRSLLLDTLRLYVLGRPSGGQPLVLYPDQALYQPGDTVQLTVQSHLAGTLEWRAFDESGSLSLAPSTPDTLAFTLPGDLVADTYQATYRFTSDDGRIIENATSFEVDGDRASVRRVVLDWQAEGCSGELSALLKVESRRPMTGVTLNWHVAAPDGRTVSTSGALTLDLPAGVSWWQLPATAFASGQAGTHRLHFQLAQANRELAWGTQGFDVGQAVVLGLAVPQSYYRTSWPVNASAALFSKTDDPATLQVTLDGGPVAERTVDQAGYSVEPLALGTLPEGEHSVGVTLVGSDGCRSQATAGLPVYPLPNVEIVTSPPTGFDGWHVFTPSIYLRTDETLSPVEGYYAWDVGGERRYEGDPLDVPFDGQRILSAWVVADDGSASPVMTQTLFLDRVRPQVEATIAGQKVVTVTLTATDATSGVYWTGYRVDGSAWLTYTLPFVFEPPKPSQVDYRTRDVAGNWSLTGTVYMPCELYPIAIHTDTLGGVAIGDEMVDVLNGDGPGNFGWLSWTGDPSEPTLVQSLTPYGDSETYVNPYDPDDHVLSVEDWAQGKPGVSDSQQVRGALDNLKTYTITVPVWDTSTGQGDNLNYHVVGFARIQITDYRLPGQNRISAIYWGPAICGVPSEDQLSAVTSDWASALQGRAISVGLAANDDHRQRDD